MFEERDHFLDRMLQADPEGAGDDGKSNVQLLDALKPDDVTDVVVLEPVPGGDRKAERMALACGSLKRVKFARLGASGSRMSIAAGMELDLIRPDPVRRPDLAEDRINEHAHLDPPLPEGANERPKRAGELDHVQPAFRRELLASLGNERDLSGFDGEGDLDHGTRDGHLEIEPSRHPLQTPDILILDMAAIFPQVAHDAGGPGPLTEASGFDRIGPPTASGLPKRRHVIDINAESHEEISWKLEVGNRKLEVGNRK